MHTYIHSHLLGDELSMKAGLAHQLGLDVVVEEELGEDHQLLAL